MGIFDSAKRFLGGFFQPAGQQQQRPINPQGKPSSAIKTSDPGFKIQFPQASAAGPTKSVAGASTTKPYQLGTTPGVRYSTPEEQAKLRAFDLAQRTGGGQPTPSAPTPPSAPPTPQQQFSIPSASDFGVPSAQDAAQQAAEEKERIQQEKQRRFGELITPLRTDVESYLKSRRPITELFQEEMGKQGIPGKQAQLSTLEGEATKLGGQLETIPEEAIQRRKETGMLSAAAERRIRSLEERPIREQLLKITGAKETERVGLQRAYQLLDKILDLEREQERRGQEPLEYRLKGAEEQFGIEGEGFKSQIDSIASQLSGFNKDREAKLKEYEMQVDAGLKLTMAQQKEAADLKKLELQHLNTMQQIAARQRGEAAGDKTPEIEELQARIREGATSSDLVKEFVQTGLLDISIVEKQLDKAGSVLTANKQAAEEEGGGAPE